MSQIDYNNIDSLRSRIQELEQDVSVKRMEIIKIRQDFNTCIMARMWDGKIYVKQQNELLSIQAKWWYKLFKRLGL